MVMIDQKLGFFVDFLVKIYFIHLHIFDRPTFIANQMVMMIVFIDKLISFLTLTKFDGVNNTHLYKKLERSINRSKIDANILFVQSIMYFLGREGIVRQYLYDF